MNRPKGRGIKPQQATPNKYFEEMAQYSEKMCALNLALLEELKKKVTKPETPTSFEFADIKIKDFSVSLSSSDE